MNGRIAHQNVELVLHGGGCSGYGVTLLLAPPEGGVARGSAQL
jgi:hypothetical protein